MNLAEHYKQLYKIALEKFQANDYELDPLIDSTNDQRFGITLLLRPSEEVKARIQLFLEELKAIEPTLFYYPNSDIHITVMSIISCYDGFDLSQINQNAYIKLIEQSISNIPPFAIQFKGITASPSCVMIQGFMEDDSLNQLRNQLRENFKQSTLQQSLDKRYAIQTAHSTVVRFRAPITNSQDLISTFDKYRAYDFGTFEVKTLELVYNDWYQRKEKVKTLQKFNLK